MANQKYYPVITHVLNAQPPVQVPQPQPVVQYNFQSWIQKTSAQRDNSLVSGVPFTCDWKSIFAIDQICGVNLEDKRFEFKVGDFMFLFTIPLHMRPLREKDHYVYYQTAALKKRVCFVGTSLEVFINMQDTEKKAIFVVSFCKCTSCMHPWIVNTVIQKVNSRTFEFDTASLIPVDMILSLKYKEEKHVTKLTFQPGVVDRFDMAKENDVNSCFFAVKYYCSVPLDSLPIFPFKDFVKRVTSRTRRSSRMTMRTDMNEENISIEITAITPTPAVRLNALEQNHFQQQSSSFSALYEKKEYADLVVFSKDGKPFHCNKAILCVRSPVFERMLTGGNFIEGQEGTVKLEEGALATEALIKYIYFQDTGIRGLSFIGMVGTLKLAHFYEFMELMSTSAKALLGKMRGLEWEDVEALWELYSFVSKMETIQVIVRLKLPSIMTLRRLIQAKKNKRARRDEEDVNASVNRAFGNHADLAKDLALDLFRLLEETT